MKGVHDRIKHVARIRTAQSSSMRSRTELCLEHAVFLFAAFSVSRFRGKLFSSGGSSPAHNGSCRSGFVLSCASNGADALNGARRMQGGSQFLRLFAFSRHVQHLLHATEGLMRSSAIWPFGIGFDRPLGKRSAEIATASHRLSHRPR